LPRRRSLSGPGCIPTITATIVTQRSCILRRSPPAPNNATATAVLARAALCSGLRRRTQSDRSIRRGQQQQEECPVSFVIGSGSAAFPALHDHVPFGCADAPVPFSAAPLQDYFKDWKSTIRDLKDWKLIIRHGNRDKRGPIEKTLHEWSVGMPSHFCAGDRGQPRWAMVWPSRCRNQDRLNSWVRGFYLVTLLRGQRAYRLAWLAAIASSFHSRPTPGTSGM
jgi:hypothetical protein